MTRCHILCLLLVLGHASALSAQSDDVAPTEGEAAEAEAQASEAEAEVPASPIPEGQLAEARQRLARGQQLFDEGNFDAALVEFQEALGLLTGHPMRFLVLYNVGKAYEQLFRYDQAMETYEAFLVEGGADTELAPEVRAKVELLNGLLGVINLTINVRNYQVWVDDRMIGANRSSIRVPGGNHVVEVRADGYVPAQQEVQVPARAERSLTFSLDELAEEFEGLPSWLFWASTGVAVASLAVGVVFAIIALNKNQDLKALEDEPLGGLGLFDMSDVDDMRDTARNADIMFGVAGVFAITALTFALFTEWGGSNDEEPEAEPTARWQLAPVAGPGFGGLSAEGTF